MSTELLRRYIDILSEEAKQPTKQETERRARELAAKMGVAAPNLIDFEQQGGVAVKINGDTVPANLYTPDEKRLIAAARQLSGGAAAQPPQRDQPSSSNAPTSTQVQTDDSGNHMITTPDGKTIVVGPDGKPLPNGGREQSSQSGSQAASPSAGGQSDTGAQNPPGETGTPSSDRVTALQKELKAKGADLGNFGPAGDGVDGKLGRKTREAAAKFPEIAAKYRDVLGGGQGSSPAAASGDTAKLTNALGAIEAILSKYKIKTNEAIDPLDTLVLENINLYSPQEQLEIWKILAEDDKPRLPPGAKYDRATGNWYTVDSSGRKTVLGGTSTTKPADTFMPSRKQSRLGKFLGRLGGRRGIAKKVGARLGASALTGPAALAVGAGMAAWTAWDVGKALYDTFASTDLEDLDPQDQEIIKKNLATIMQYQKDPKLVAALDPEVKVRLERVMKGLDRLAVKAEATPAAPAAGQAASPSVDQRTADRVRDASGPVQSSTSTQGTLIANEPVIPGQPLSQKQMAVMKMAIDMGNSYPPEIMAQYNKQRRGF